MKMRSKDLRKRLMVKFHGEEGLDYGGVARSVWFCCLNQTLTNSLLVTHGKPQQKFWKDILPASCIKCYVSLQHVLNGEKRKHWDKLAVQLWLSTDCAASASSADMTDTLVFVCNCLFVIFLGNSESLFDSLQLLCLWFDLELVCIFFCISALKHLAINCCMLFLIVWEISLKVVSSVVQGMVLLAVSWDVESLLWAVPILQRRYLHTANQPRLGSQSCKYC